MASISPIVRQVAWFPARPQIAILIFMMISALFFGFQNYVLVGAVIYLAISFCLRFGVPYHHRKGITLLKKGVFIEAIPFFEKSYGFSK